MYKFYFDMITLFSIETTYLGFLVAKIMVIIKCKISCHFLIHFSTCSLMAAFVFGGLV